MIINKNFDLKDLGYSNFNESSNLPRFKWYSYKEGFSPSLVNYAIDSFNNFNKAEDLIVDPFNGSGTTTLFSSLNNYKSIGFEVNPFSAFVSKVKETNLTQKQIELLKHETENILRIKSLKKSPLLEYSTFSKTKKNEKYLFNPEVLNFYESAKVKICNVTDTKVRNILILANLSSIMKNCNAKKDGKCLRYKNNWLDLNYDAINFKFSFSENVANYIEDISLHPVRKPSKIFSGDSRKIIENKLDKFKLCITSPPYLNSFDYTDIYRPELFLGDFVKSSEQLKKQRNKTFCSHIHNSKKFNSNISFGLNYDVMINSIIKKQNELWSVKIVPMIQTYFSDMYNMLKSLRMKGAKNSQLWMVVGNSAYLDSSIPTDLIIAEIGNSVGWHLKEIGVMRYIHKRGSIYSPSIKNLRESVIIFSSTKF